MDTTGTQLMTEPQARIFREAYAAAVKRYSRMTIAQLKAERTAALADQGIESLYGGPGSKDEFVSAVLNLRGYTVARLNDTTHVLYHGPGESWSACDWCHPHQGAPCECSRRAEAAT
jgi:hypothetical protein